ncbi:uncharacterized protein BO97DRAFT_477741 [Aspergillus homomorphus CBS 101889]|uniref:Uncharacterized protein n=1 Tax=Aspergillus homomorphus (strain CBS 101889) TaxID=1450537 RepID=A0A395HY93_ASPHC|nr:hypothetical protein BO97DRAFT_477741 [Aspergillus homomorphus CBS 101889]RAL12750.1 hypothetical protein BO97DRAFT_477741 [Aspergillus homomorphus CBS 101889]
MICAGHALLLAGPASILISYTCVGIIVYLVLCALGEVASWSPEPSMAENASRFCDPALGFTLGWIYWLKFMVVIPNQFAAGELLIAFWQGDEKVYSIFWITFFLTMIIVANSRCSQYFDRYELLLSSVKIIVMFGLVCLCVVLACGGGPDHDKKGFRYWSYPGAFAQHSGREAMGILRAIVRTVPSATLAYLGSELMGITILRTHNPREVAGQAIESNCYRILAFNIVNVALLGILVPSGTRVMAFSQPSYRPRPASAFVAIAQYTGWPKLPHILNAFLLVCVISAANQALYMATRTLYELAIDQHAPSFLCRTNGRGIPIYALGICALIGCTAYLNCFSRSQKLFNNHVNLVSMFSILTWGSILVVHISFVRVRKVQKIADDDLVFKAPFGVLGSWVALLACVFISIIRVFDLTNRDAFPKGFDYAAFVTSYVWIPLYAILAVGYKLATRTHSVQPESVDMRTTKAAQNSLDAGCTPAAPGAPIQAYPESARMRRMSRRSASRVKSHSCIRLQEMSLPTTPARSGRELIQVIHDINKKYSLDIPNPRIESPGSDNKSLAWRCYYAIKQLYFRHAPLYRVLENFDEWVSSRSITQASTHSGYAPNAVLNSAGQRSLMGKEHEREERLGYLFRLLDDEVYFLREGSFPANKPIDHPSTEPEHKGITPRFLKRRLSADEDEFHTAPSSPVKAPARSVSPMETESQAPEERRSTTATVPINLFQSPNRPEPEKKHSGLVDRMLAPQIYRKYDAVPAAQSDADPSFATTITSESDFFATRNNSYNISFITTITEPMPENESMYEDSVVEHMLSEETRDTFEQQILASELDSEPRYFDEEKVMRELLKHGPFTYEQTSPRSVPLRYRYELERTGRAWGVPLSRMLVGGTIPFKSLDDYWHWIASHNQRNGKPLPEKPTRKAWEAATGDFKTDKHSEVVVLTGDMEWCTESENGVLKLSFHPLKTERTCRFHRRFGSDRFLSLTMPAPARPPPHLRVASQSTTDLQEILALWLTHNVHRCLGREWRPFFVEEVKSKRKVKSEPRFRVDFFAVDGIDFDHSVSIPASLPSPNQNSTNRTKMSVDDLIEWHMPWKANIGQSNCKLFQRLSLGLSKTYATVVMRPSQILALPDAPGRPVMNDGCALMSRAMASCICDMLGITGDTPSAFQGRFAGAKGLWMVDRHQSQLSAECGDDIWIQISDSQLKIQPHPQTWKGPVDNEQLTFEVVKWSKPLHSVNLNIQLLAILQQGGHVRDHIADLTRHGIQAVYKDFVEVLESDSPVLCRSLIQKIRPSADDKPGLMSHKVKRLERWTANDAEFIIRLTEAGFAPRSFFPLRKRLGKVLKDVLERYEEELHIEVPLSTYAFCIADPYGILKEDEVHFGFSTNWRDGQGQFEDTLLDGIDVLVGRLPAHLPSDIQRRRAVWRSELRHFKDVIVFPSVGDVALAHMLSGGDYDGDRPWICWDQNIVRHFSNSDLPSSHFPPNFFGLTEESVPIEEIESVDEFLQSAFTFNLTLSNLGRCTVEHEMLAYDESISAPRAVELASLLSYLVDGRKVGVQLPEEAWTRYRAQISPQRREPPAYKNPGRKPKKAHITDFLKFEVAGKEREKVLTQFESQFPEKEGFSERDEDLVRVYNEVRQQATQDKELKTALQAVSNELRALHAQWTNSFARSQESFSARALQIAEEAQALEPPLGNHPLFLVWQHCPAEWLRFLASSTYKLYPNFSFVMHAFGEVLCQMKTSNLSARTVTHEVLACYRVNQKVIAQLTARDTMEEEDTGSGDDEYEGHEAIEAMHLGLPSAAAGGYYDPDDGMSVE